MLLSCFERNRKITGPSMVVKQQTSQHMAPFTTMDRPCYYKWCVHIMAGRKPPVRVGAGDTIEKGRKVIGLNDGGFGPKRVVYCLKKKIKTPNGNSS